MCKWGDLRSPCPAQVNIVFLLSGCQTVWRGDVSPVTLCYEQTIIYKGKYADQKSRHKHGTLVLEVGVELFL